MNCNRQIQQWRMQYAKQDSMFFSSVTRVQLVGNAGDSFLIQSIILLVITRFLNGPFLPFTRSKNEVNDGPKDVKGSANVENNGPLTCRALKLEKDF